MAAATAINAEAFTNRDMAENNSANQSECEWPRATQKKHLDKETVAAPVERE